ncbi:M60 family metallopeptidase [Streptomyces sp. NBC_00237]|uniref:M60 family metallopeptidase n=1 Tax=Streptomyces sp. NBC_00237 TaxID=2975687 RepID=UPI0022574CCE|nr:M60 family metallopeptidase [Streptomyces sp. NBC_00237]MCX5205523.1 M60 family metallopeptidase [Streptomyces sp. NBC_00237]
MPLPPPGPVRRPSRLLPPLCALVLAAAAAGPVRAAPPQTPPHAPSHAPSSDWSELRVFGTQCLTVGDLGRTWLASCRSGLGEPTPANQRWRFDAAPGVLRGAVADSGGRPQELSVPGGAKAGRSARPVLVPAGQAQGGWAYGPQQHLEWAGTSMVLDYHTSDDYPALYSAGEGDNQKWEFTPAAEAVVAPDPTDAATELRVDGRCLTLAGYSVPNAAVTVEPCASAAGRVTPSGQRWVVADGQVRTAAPPYRVLGIEDGGGKAPVARLVNDGSDRMRWQYDAPTGALRWAADPSRALDHARGTSYAGLYGYHGDTNQQWKQHPPRTSPGPSVTQATPGEVRATALTPTSARLEWAAPEEGARPASYVVHRDGGRIATTGGTSYTDEGVGPGGNHRYQVTAVSADGVESAPGAAGTLKATACPASTEAPDLALPVPVRGTPYTVTLTGQPSASAEQERLGLNLAPSDVRPTGLYLPPGGTLNVAVGAGAAEGSLRVRVGPPVAWPAPRGRAYPLASSGTAKVTDRRGGMVYLAFDGQPSARVTVTLSGDAEPVPVFRLGRTTADQWRAALAAGTSRYAELVGGRTLVTLSRDTAARYAQASPEAVLRHLECARALEDAAAGLDDSAPEHAPGVFPYHYVEVERRIGAAFAADAYTGFQYDSAPWIADSAAAGWGVWHEQGHKRQQRAVQPSALTEVSVNVFSLAVQKAFQQRSRLVSDSVYDRALKKVGAPGVDFDKSFDAFERLVMLQQLTLQYGDDFWPRAQRRLRERPMPGGDRWRNLAVLTSRVAGQDLTAFYAAWGVPLTDGAKGEIAALGLPTAPASLAALREK